ncbi:MAG: transporter substrate-binding domain-containing protein [Muribaculaceae bacterium]|nr:transporter substrate-binding domain-containing protein [Muribaculaceae bacterium]
MNKLRHIIAAGVAAMAAVAAVSCGHRTAGESVNALPDTLRVATLYSPTSYFIYRDEPMGYDYTLVSDFAEAKGMVLDLRVARSMSEAVAMLDSGTVDLLACDVPVTSQYRGRVLACGPEMLTTQVLVQPKEKGKAAITDVTQLPGKDIYVESGSKYEQRLRHLDEELGGGINIHTVDADSLIDEDLIQMVSDGKIPLTVVNRNVARLNATYYPDLDVSLEVSFPQRAAWGVAPQRAWLADSVDTWMATADARRDNADLLKRYFEMSKGRTFQRFDFSKGYISSYDKLFKTYADRIGWDWRLLAAQGWAESRFKPTARSWVGARGLMQIMPRTARGYRTPVSKLNNPEVSINVATQLLRDLNRQLQKYVPNDRERLKFVIGSYNVGIAHVLDAMRLCDKYGMDPQVWDDNVERALLMKSKPEYYNDPVVKYGYCRGSEPVAYVRDIMAFYDTARREIQA